MREDGLDQEIIPEYPAMEPGTRSEHPAATVDIERLRVALVRRDEQVARLVRALTDIADTDYRGNRSTESVRAHRALVEEGFRAE